jgi:hypothetical protein
MDIAAFVGFAASGPVHVPVLVEDVAQFESIFGDDLPLAWDPERGEQAYAYLAPAVRAFFRNGGRRCWIIRVAAETAQTAWFPVPGLARFDGNALLPAFAPARSPGAWAEALRLGTALSSEPIQLLPSETNFDTAGKTLDLFLKMPGQVIAGDLLRLTYVYEGYSLFFPVLKLASLSSEADAPEAVSAQRARASADKLFCFRPAKSQLPTSPHGTLTAYTHTGVASTVEIEVTQKSESTAGDLDWPGDEESLVSLNVTGRWGDLLKTTCAPGALVRVDFDGSDPEQSFWMLIERCTVNNSSSDPSRVRPYLAGQGIWQVPVPHDLGLPDLLERLTFEIWARQPQKASRHLSNLGFTASQPRFWAALPTDEQLYLAQASAVTGDSSFEQPSKNNIASRESRTDLWQSAQLPRFPFAGPGESEGVFLPLLIKTIPTLYAGPHAVPGDALEHEGLNPYNAGLFLDPDLAGVSTQTLLEQANHLRYTHPNPRRLRGLHAALSLEEVTLIAVPDAVQRGWQKPEIPNPPSAPDFERSLPRPEWWHFAPCQSEAKVKPIAEPDRGKFQRCSLHIIAVPELSATEPDAAGSFTVQWTAVGDPEDETVYILQESASPKFSDPILLYQGTEIQYTIYGYPQGSYYFRVRAERLNPHEILKTSRMGTDAEGNFTLTWHEVGDIGYCLEASDSSDFKTVIVLYRGARNSCVVHADPEKEQFFRVRIVESSDWSHGVMVRIAPGTTWQLTPQSLYNLNILRAIQLNLLRMCEARGDIFAILSAPSHSREQTSIDYALDLRSPIAEEILIDVPALESLAEMKRVKVAALGYGEAHNLGFGALYHPWLYSTDNVSGVARLNPPDGYVTGILAQRAYERGAWVAPANQPMRGVIALGPLLHPEHWLDIQEAHINLIRQEPQGFLTLSENTLSDDPDWTLINVRRLISLIRRLAQRYGPTWVFEPNDEAFARLVKRTFVSLLDQMFARGAFAGRTPQSAYQVDVHVTPKDIEEGRFIVELRVAPSQPMRFITIRLVQSGERSLVTEGG